MKKLIKRLLGIFNNRMKKLIKRFLAILNLGIVRLNVNVVDPTLLATETWVRHGSDVGGGELKSLFQNTANSHKWPHYYPIYERVFSKLRLEPIKLLEIGVYKGASLRVWHNYFHSGSTVVGIDVDNSCTRF